MPTEDKYEPTQRTRIVWTDARGNEYATHAEALVRCLEQEVDDRLTKHNELYDVDPAELILWMRENRDIVLKVLEAKNEIHLL